MMRPLLVCALALSACVTVNTVVIDRKTALEQQFVGEFEELSDDLEGVASVRAEAALGMGVLGDDPYARALQAKRIQKFYAADIDRVRERGCVGEAQDGHLRRLPCPESPPAAPSPPASSSPSAEPSIDRLVQLENFAREALVAYALGQATALSGDDKPGEKARASVWQAYRKVVLVSLKPGSMVQNNAGQWVRQ